MSRKWFRTSVCHGIKSFEHIDNETEVIQGVAVTSEGEARGHNVQLNSEFIQRTVELGNTAKNGIKARFGHPNMSSTALGTFVGRFKDFRVDGNIARADLHLSQTAEKTPHGNLKEYVTEMAAKEPDMFGTSIVFTPGKSFRIGDDGARVFEDDPDFFELKGDTFATIDKLHGADVVDDPAANDGMFSAWSADMLAARVTDFLDANPGLFSLLDENPDILESFMARYREYKTENNTEELIMDEKKTTEPAAVADEPVATPEIDVQSLTAAAVADSKNEFSRMVDEFGADFAAECYTNGIGYSEALTKHHAILKDRINEYEASAADIGTEPLTAFDADEDVDKDAAAYEAKVKELESRIGTNNARFAAGLKFA